MGVCQSHEAIKAKEVSNKIDRDLQTDKRFQQKLLLLGPAESGKSTCVKQMQILHNNGFSKIELEELRSMYELTKIMQELGLKFQDTALENEVMVLRSHVENGLEYNPINTQVKLAIQRLWKDPSINTAYKNNTNYHVIESASYFFENIERVAEKDYWPTNQDILMSRMATTGVVKLVFNLKNIEFNVFDVGGQRSERRKWIHFFDDVNAIIFVAAISEFDQNLREDNRTRISLNILFPNYKGALNYKDGVAYLRQKFRKLYRNKQKLYIHETFATDTNQINAVFTSVLDTIIHENMEDTGML
uniref:Guanine nucleotide binding protein, alpha subunit n=1 Tax=Globodera pallida TaxID=36090 RepID=A0A183BKR3_GLOPA